MTAAPRCHDSWGTMPSPPRACAQYSTDKHTRALPTIDHKSDSKIRSSSCLCAEEMSFFFSGPPPGAAGGENFRLTMDIFMLKSLNFDHAGTLQT